MPKASILILTSSFPRWPNDTDPPFVYQLAQRLSDSFDITVLAPHCKGAQRREKLGNLNVVRFKYFIEKHQKLAYQGGILSNLKNNFLLYSQVPFFFLLEFLALIILIVTLKPKVIHAHWIIPQALIAVIACRFINTPPRILCTSHGADIYGLKDPISKIFRRFVLRNIDACAAVSAAMRDEISRESGDARAIKVIPMGVDLQFRFVPGKNAPKKHQLLFVGRLVEKKGLSYLLEAMPYIRREVPDVSLLIIGDGHKKHIFKKFVSNNGLDDCVIFLGAVPNNRLIPYYQNAELLVFPSIIADDGDREGLGLVPVEAMGCGCAVVVTDLYAIRDVVQNGINGIVVPQRSAKAIAEAVVRLFSNRSQLEHYRRMGRQSVCEKFDWDMIAEKYRSTLQALIDM